MIRWLRTKRMGGLNPFYSALLHFGASIDRADVTGGFVAGVRERQEDVWRVASNLRNKIQSPKT